MSMRLPKQSGEWISRDKALRFTFEGQEYTGYEGDTISSALLAAGVKVLGRSFKYHRPRSVLSFANHDVNVMVTDGTDTNIRGDVVALQANMTVKAVNTDGGVLKDKNKYIDSLSPLLPVGFYYKAFHKPASLFPFWEKIIRKAAGLGVVNFNYPRITKRKLNVHCDVLVVGAGPSGLSAALAAASNGLEVVLVEENQKLGGSLTYDYAGSDSSKNILEQLQEKVAETSNIRIYTGAYAAGYYADHMVPVVTADGITRVRAKAVIIATGAFEQPPVFHNNDLPGVMLGSAAQRLISRYAVMPFSKGVVVTANAHGYRVALDLLNAGSKVVALVDMRAESQRDQIVGELVRKGVKIYAASCVYEAVPTKDKLGVRAAVICPFDEASGIANTDKPVTLECDGIAMSAGWAPAAALLYQSGIGMGYNNDIQQFVPNRLPAGVFAAGKVNGVYSLQQRANDGMRAAAEVLRYLGKNAPEVVVDKHQGPSPSHSYPFVDHPKGKNFVDFDEDIQIKDFINAAKEGFDNIELMKRFTTVGMGPSQGKHSNMNAIRILARIRNLPVEKIGTTTARPFFHPTPFGHLGGRSFHSHRLTSLHGWHKAAGAFFVDVGAWSRPAYYQRSGLSKQQIVQDEANAVRQSAGIIDGGTLGKIEVCGPDAALFLERFYTGKFADQAVGTSRYALLLDESAVIVDDGIASRLADELFYLTISTSNAAAVYREMQRWLQIWQLNVGLVNVTGAYGLINVAGPASRDIVSKLVDIDLSDAAFAMGSVKETELMGIPVRMVRVGFVAKLAYEIHMPSAYALQVWRAILETGFNKGIRTFGTDAQRLLRLELGHHMPGYDTDGLTNPYEISAESALSMDKPFFIGQRSLKIIAKKPLNKILVPFVLPQGYSAEMPQDCNLVTEGAAITGRVTSIGYSPAAKRIVGLAYVAPTQSIHCTVFEIKTDNGSIAKATVVKTPFFNAE
ncbi:MAG: 2Fe-2S iron-sulfur cluster-binding protein [Nitrosomonadales bacterium]|nr:2Fe-2S iron-sulfur cluster-binding protein [Nitrosomonadales bacterium]